MRELKEKLAELKNQVNQTESELQKEYDKVFEDCQFLQEILSKLENSTHYFAEYDEICRYVDFCNIEKFEEDSNYLENYLSEYHLLRVDWENRLLIAGEGPSIIVNEDGDVLDQDSGKWIIKRNDYKTERERNLLIESWMEETGYFPGVFSVDRHGNTFSINTREEV
jgi:hypothetical protein